VLGLIKRLPRKEVLWRAVDVDGEWKAGSEGAPKHLIVQQPGGKHLIEPST